MHRPASVRTRRLATAAAALAALLLGAADAHALVFFGGWSSTSFQAGVGNTLTVFYQNNSGTPGSAVRVAVNVTDPGGNTTNLLTGAYVTGNFNVLSASVGYTFPEGGTYTFSFSSEIEGAAAPSMNGTSTQSVSVAVAASQEAVTFTFAPLSFVYSGQPQGPAVVPSDPNATYSTSGTPTATQAGDYSISATANGKYSGNGSQGWSISPAPVSFSLDVSDFTYDGASQGPTVVCSVAGATFATGGTSSATDPGTYTVSATASGNYSGSGALSWTIWPAAAPTAGLSAVPSSGTAPLSIQVAWTTSNASSALVSGPGLGSSSLSGSQGVTLASPGTYTFSLTASGLGGRASSSATVTVNPAQSTQTIAFSAPATAAFPGSPITLTAAASSGLPVSFSLVSGNASLTGNQLTLEGAGPVVVQATQAGDAQWLPAAPVSQSIDAVAGRIARIRSNAGGRDARVGVPGAGGGGFLWTDPEGIQASAWPGFANPQPAAVSSQPTELAPPPQASSGIH